MQVIDVVSRALRLLRVLDPNEAVEAQDFETAIFALNVMMARWEADGVSVGWQTVKEPTETLPAPPEAIQAITYNLAVELSDEYGQAVSQTVAIRAQESLSSLYRDVLVANPILSNASGPNPNNGWPYYNIVSDTVN